MPPDPNPTGCCNACDACCPQGYPLVLYATIAAPGTPLDKKVITMVVVPPTSSQCEWQGHLTIGDCVLLFRYWHATNVCYQRFHISDFNQGDCFPITDITSVPCPMSSPQVFTNEWGCSCIEYEDDMTITVTE